MYRIQENSNGSVSVFDASTGNLAMVVKNENKENNDFKQPAASLNKQVSKMGQCLTISNAAICTLKDKLLPAVALPSIKICNSLKVLRPFASNKSSVWAQENEEEQDDYDCIDKDTFMGLFDLVRKADGMFSHTNSKNCTAVVPPKYSRNNIHEVDLSSQLGNVIRNSTQFTSVDEQHVAATVAKYEKFCYSSSRHLGNGVVTNRPGNLRYPVTFMRNSYQRSHLYSFNRSQRLQRYRTLKTGLSERSRRLRRLCKQAIVPVVRLTKSDIERLKQNLKAGSVQSAVDFSRDREVDAIRNPPIFSLNSLVNGEICIDGTVVIEIDDYGSETVTVSPKRSRPANGMERLPQRNLFDSTRTVSVNLNFDNDVIMDDISSLPSKNDKDSFTNKLRKNLSFIVTPVVPALPSTTSTNPNCSGSSNLTLLSSTNSVDLFSVSRKGDELNVPLTSREDSDSDDGIQFLGVYRNSENYPRRRLSMLPGKRATSVDSVSQTTASKRHEGLSNGAAVAQKRLAFENFSTQRECSLSLKSNMVSILKPCGNRSLEDRERPHFEKKLITHVGDTEVLIEEPAEGKSIHEAEIDLITQLIIGYPSCDSDQQSEVCRNVNLICTFHCHICQTKATYCTNIVNSVYKHMLTHGGLSGASLISSVDDGQASGMVQVLQAYPHE